MKLTLFAVFALAAPLVSASDGDADGKYRACANGCFASCPQFESPHTLAWTCRDECRYECMWQQVGKRRLSGLPVQQYHGKWPFRAILGMQEPASVLASILNLLAHIYGILHYRRALTGLCWQMSKYHHVNAVLAVAAWTVSAIFHARDRHWTERADYYAATALIFWNLAYTAIRLFRLDQFALPVVFGYAYALFHHISYVCHFLTPIILASIGMAVGI